MVPTLPEHQKKGHWCSGAETQGIAAPHYFLPTTPGATSLRTLVLLPSDECILTDFCVLANWMTPYRRQFWFFREGGENGEDRSGDC